MTFASALSSVERAAAAAGAQRRPARGSRYRLLRVTIPSYETLTVEERTAVDLGGAWPVRAEELTDPERPTGSRPIHLALIDFLIQETLKCSAD